MNLIANLAERWLATYSVHLLEISLFILLVWLVDRALRLEVRVRYLLWALALLKVFVPPVLSLPTFAGSTIAEPVVWLPFDLGTASGQTAAGSVSTSQVLFMLWLSSVFGVLLFVLSKHVWMGVRLRAARPVELKRVQQLAPNLPVFESEEVQTPTLLGLVRPKMYLPVEWRTWTEGQLNSVVQHECAHLQHRDGWVLLAQYLALALFAVNPFVWLVHRRLNHVRELLCDEAAVRASDLSAAEYGRTLLMLAEARGVRGYSGVLSRCFFRSESSIRKRIQHLLHWENRPPVRKWLRYLVPIAAAALMVPFSWRCSPEQQLLAPPSSETPAAPKVAAPDSAAAPKPAPGTFVAFDEAPKPVGGFEAIQERLKYPDIARKAGIEGQVIVQVRISESGEVTETRVLRSLGHSGVDEAAVEAIKSVKWEPARNQGKPVAARVAIPVTFKLGPKPTDEPAEPPAAPPNLPPETFVAFDEAPKPVGGFEAIQQRLQYPDLARKAGIEGQVIVHVHISESGEVTETRVLRSLGHSGVDEAAVAAVRSVQWQPARKDGKPVAVWVAVPVLFKLGAER